MAIAWPPVVLMVKERNTCSGVFVVRILVVALFFGLVGFSMQASAESTIVYSRGGKVSSVVRPSPSGFHVYDRHGHLVQSARDWRPNGTLFVETRPYNVIATGSTLSGGAGGTGAGVGFQ